MTTRAADLVRAILIGVVIGTVVMTGSAIRLGGLALGWSRVPSGLLTDPTVSPPASWGPHGVGVRSLSMDPSAVDAMFWYPSTVAADVGSIAYHNGVKVLGGSPYPIAVYRGIGVREAAPDTAHGPYPLIVLSPGYGFGSGAYAWLTEHLVSHGFAVLGIEHAEVLDPSGLWRASVDRPRDMILALDFADAQAAGPWRGIVDTTRVAVMGHSYGGYTALAAAGARIDGQGIEAVCEAAGPAQPIAFLCSALVPRLEEMARAAGLDSVPTGLWPGWGDGRVDAVISMAGDALLFGEAGMAEVAVPVLAIGGTADVDSPYAWGTQLSYQAASSARKVEVGLAGAEHLLFTGPCETSRRLFTVVREPFCADPAWERADAHALVRRVATAFLRAELLQDADAADELAAGALALPSVRQATTGY